MKPIVFFLMVLTFCVSGFGQSNVVGGEFAEPGEYPWVVQLRGDGQTICGGALIAPNWVLTAGHCGEGMPPYIPAPDQVYVNLYTADSPNQDAELISVESIFVHEDFSLSNFGNAPDIALLKLETPSTYTPVRYADSSDVNFYATGTKCTVLGWGSTDNQGSTSDTLKEAEIEVINFDTCTENYSNTPQGGPGKFVLCAGYTSGMSQSGAGSGDSGGPLVAFDGSEWVHVGIVSAGNGVVTTEEYPGLYTKTMDMSRWIDSVISANSAPAFVKTSKAIEGIEIKANDSRIEISYPGKIEGTVSIYSITGALVWEAPTVIDHKAVIPVNQEAYRPGLYVVTVASGEKKASRKFSLH